MQSLRFYDCNASFGMRSLRNPGFFYKKEELLQKMDDYSIERALATHSMSKEYDPQVGNGILMDELKGEMRLFPVWAFLPHYTGEFDPPDRLLENMKKNGVRAVTVFPAPSCQNFSFAEFSCGGLFRVFEEYGIPLFLSMDQLGGIANLDPLCCAHPELRVVVTNVNYRVDRDLDAACKWLNYLFSDEGAWLTGVGIDGVTYKGKDADGIWQPDNARNMTDYEYNLIWGKNTLDAIQLDAPYWMQPYYPGGYTDEMTQEDTILQSAVAPIIKEESAKFITGARSPDTFGAFVKDIKEKGADHSAELFSKAQARQRKS